jgi:hypothetical protein
LLADLVPALGDGVQPIKVRGSLRDYSNPSPLSEEIIDI